jgi:hypothetical protein
MTQLRDSIKAMQQETIKDQQKLREELTEFDKNIRYAITILFGLNYSFTFNGLHNLLTLFYLFFLIYIGVSSLRYQVLLIKPGKLEAHLWLPSLALHCF